MVKQTYRNNDGGRHVTEAKQGNTSFLGKEENLHEIYTDFNKYELCKQYFCT